MTQVVYEKIDLGDIMTGHYGPTPEEATSPAMQEFEASLQNPDMYETVPADEVFATDCGDGRVDESGERQARGYFAFGGSYLPVLGEALANPDMVIKQGLKLDTHAHLRFRQLHQVNPNRVFVWHTAEGTPEGGIGCGLLAGRRTVVERIAGDEVPKFESAGNHVGVTDLSQLPTQQLQNNARRLLDSGYLDVSDKSLREVPQDIKGLAIEEVLVGEHNEWGFLVNHEEGTRLRSAELPRRHHGAQAFVTDAWGLKLEAAEWAQMNMQGLDPDFARQLAVMHNNAMGLITVSGIATLGNENLATLVRRG